MVDVDEVAGAGSAEADEVAGAEIDGSGIRHRETVTDERKRRTKVNVIKGRDPRSRDGEADEDAVEMRFGRREDGKSAS